MNELSDLTWLTNTKNYRTSTSISNTQRQKLITEFKQKLEVCNIKPVQVVYDDCVVSVNCVEYKHYKTFNKDDLIRIVERDYINVNYLLRQQHPIINKMCRNIAYHKIFNGNYVHFLKMLRMVFYRAFVLKYPPEIISNCLITVGGISQYRLNNLNVPETTEKVMEAYSDNLLNIIPLIIATGKNPKELKELFGNSLWKQVTKNTISRNKLLADYIYNKNKLHTNLRNIARAAATLPSSLLKHTNLSTSSLLYATNHYKGIWSKDKLIYEVTRDYNDLIRMIEEVMLHDSFNDEAFNKKKAVVLTWSPRRIKEEHDKYVSKLASLKASGLKYPWLDNIEPQQFSYEGYTATLLKSEKELSEEGLSMGHCVSVYNARVAKQAYMVYSIRDKDGNRYSTLGFSVHQNQSAFLKEIWGEDHITKIGISIDQNMMKYNRPVIDETVTQLAVTLAGKISENALHRQSN